MVIAMWHVFLSRTAEKVRKATAHNTTASSPALSRSAADLTLHVFTLMLGAALSQDAVLTCEARTATNSACLLHALKHVHIAHRTPTPLWVLRLGARVAATNSMERNQPGLWLEFGAWSGKSTREIANVAHNLSEEVHSFDSFLGLPEDWRPADGGLRDHSRITRKYLSSGSFSRAGKPPYTDPRIEWRVGWFNETLPQFLAEPAVARRNISFLHMDADLYSSTDTVFRQLERRIHPSAVIVFDELINYPEFEQHEIRALRELQQRTGRSARVLYTSAKEVFTSEREARDRLRSYGMEASHSGPFMQQAAIQLL